MTRNDLSPHARQRQRHRQAIKALETLTGSRYFSIYSLLIAIGLMMVAEWLPDLILNAIRTPFVELGIRSEWLIKFVLCASILIVFVVLWRTKVVESREFKIVKNVPQPTKLLAVFLSSPNFDTNSLEQSLQSGALQGEFFDEGKNWKMPIEAIKHHYPILEKIFVVTSSGDRSSDFWFDTFRQSTLRLFPNLTVENLTPGGIDFLDIQKVYEALNKRLFDSLADRQNYSVADLTIDLTGGHKLTSVAAAMLTFVEGRSFQYVSEDYKIHIYDIVPE